MLDILYHDDWLVAIHKPSGLLVHRSPIAAHEERFAWVAERDPLPYGTHAGTAIPLLEGTIRLLDAQDGDLGDADEYTVFRALYDHVGTTAFLVPAGTQLVAEGDLASAVDNPDSAETPAAVVHLDSSQVSWRGLAPSASNADVGDTSLHAAALAGLQLHLLYTPMDGRACDVASHAVMGPYARWGRLSTQRRPAKRLLLLSAGPSPASRVRTPGAGEPGGPRAFTLRREAGRGRAGAARLGGVYRSSYHPLSWPSTSGLVRPR